MGARVTSVRPSGPADPNGSLAAREPRSRDTRVRPGGSEHNASKEGLWQREVVVDLDPREDGVDHGLSCPEIPRPKEIFKHLNRLVDMPGQRIVTAPVRELT